jgi:hypothetical protein
MTSVTKKDFIVYRPTVMNNKSLKVFSNIELQIRNLLTCELHSCAALLGKGSWSDCS